LTAEHDHTRAIMTEQSLAQESPADADGEIRVNLSVDPATLGDLLLEAGEPVRAGELFELALRKEETPDLLRQLALARFRSGDHEGGTAVSRRVLRLDPQCLRSMHNLALAALQEGRIRTAAGWVWRGLRINRHDIDIRRLRVRVLIGLVKELWRRVTGGKRGA
jgi:tetratricopeptide (TPR) repeat protein